MDCLYFRWRISSDALVSCFISPSHNAATGDGAADQDCGKLIYFYKREEDEPLNAGLSDGIDMVRDFQFAGQVERRLPHEFMKTGSPGRVLMDPRNYSPFLGTRRMAK